MMISVNVVKSKIKKLKYKRHSRMSKFIIFFVIASLFVYTGLAMWVQVISGVELSPTLTTCYFGFCTGELWMLASIKKTKINNGQKSRAYSTDIDNYKGEVNVVDPDEGKDEEPKG